MSCQVFTELSNVAKMKPKAGETALSYATRLARKANDLSDSDWGGLSEPTQVWVNSALDALQHTQPVPLPEGAEAAMQAEAPSPRGDKSSERKNKIEHVPPPAELGAPRKERSTPKAKKAVESGERERINDDEKITILVDKNPHRAGSIRDQSFKVLKNGMTVKEAVAAGARRQQIWSMAARNVIKVE